MKSLEKFVDKHLQLVYTVYIQHTQLEVDNMLSVRNLCKSYEKFKLCDISFDLPAGYIMGFIGANGAGKTTTIKSLLNIVKRDSGTVTIFGNSMDESENEIKQLIGFSSGEISFYRRKKVSKLIDVYKRFFTEWSDEVFTNYMKKFHIDVDKTVSQLSEGMRVKLGVAMALSHNAKLIILDEPTSGLDPIARDELLEILRSIIEDGEHSVLFSTHITSDLDKCADYILFIKDGKIIENTTKDDLIDSYAIVSGNPSELVSIESRLVGVRPNAFGFHGLIKRADLLPSDTVEVARPNIEDIMIYSIKEAF